MYKVILLSILVFNVSILADKKTFNTNSLFRISGDNVPLRENSEITSPIITNLGKGTMIEIVYPPSFRKQSVQINQKEIEGELVYVRTTNNLSGYVFNRDIGFDFNPKVSPGFILRPKEKNVFELIGISQNNLIQNSSWYFNENALKLENIPQTKVSFLGFNGEKRNELSKLQFYKDENECDYIIICLTGKLLSDKKTDFVLGFSESKNLVFSPVILNTKIKSNFKKEIIKNTEAQLNHNSKLEDNKKWKHYEFKAQAGRKKYLISEFNSSSVRLSDSDLHIYRIDLVEDQHLKNLNFYSVTGNKSNTFKTIAITDINGDGFPEIWMEVEGYEWWYFATVILVDDLILSVYSGGGGGS